MKIFSLLLILGVFVAGCTSAPGNENAMTDTSHTGDTEMTGNVVEVSMIARNWEFEPETITVNRGDTVKLSIYSEDIDHGFALSEYGINEVVAPGETVIVEFVADKAGTFNTFCSVPCGSGHGEMRGSLVVL